MILLATLSFLLGNIGYSGTRPSRAEPLKPAIGRRTASFMLVDTSGKKRSLADYRGRSVVLFFFCGCSRCTDCARQWSDLQNRDALPRDGAGRQLTVTMVIFSGNASELKHLAAESGLDAAQSVLMPDHNLSTVTRYQAAPCPRVFVLDADGVLRYTNDQKGDSSLAAPVSAIVNRTLTSLQRSLPASSRPARRL